MGDKSYLPTFITSRNHSFTYVNKLLPKSSSPRYTHKAQDISLDRSYLPSSISLGPTYSKTPLPPLSTSHSTFSVDHTLSVLVIPITKLHPIRFGLRHIRRTHIQTAYFKFIHRRIPNQNSRLDLPQLLHLLHFNSYSDTSYLFMPITTDRRWQSFHQFQVSL